MGLRNDGERPFTVGTVGTVSRVKGTDVFLQAAQLAVHAAPHIRIEHLGSPHLHRDVGLDDELTALLGDPLLHAATSMRGQQPAAGALDRWDVYVSASRSEAFPLAVLEAMVAGLPVIATAVGGVPEQIEHLRTGILVPPDDPQAIASWLERLRQDPDLRQRLGAAAAERAATEFTLASQAEGIHRAYLGALDLRFGPPSVRAHVRELA
jgi:glycosyltransferase involved in cell wall biosynthesis